MPTVLFKGADMKKPYLTKSIYKDIDEVEEIDFSLRFGTATLFNVGVLKGTDVVGIHGMVCGKYYSGLTVVVQPVKVLYDKWGFPFYRVKRYSKPYDRLSFENIHNPEFNFELR